MRSLGGHHQHAFPVGQLAVDHPDVGDHAAVGVVDRVEDQRAGRRRGIAHRRRDLGHDRVQQLGNALAGLRRDPEHLGRIAADDPRHLGGVLVRLRARQVDLVEHRDDVQVGVQREVQVGQGLGLDPLRGIDQQHRALAGGEAAGDLVGEVDVTRSVDHVQHVRTGGFAPRGPPRKAWSSLRSRVLITTNRLLRRVGGPRHPDGLALDGDAPLALDVHPVQILRAHRPLVHHPGQLQHPVRQRRLPMIDVSDDAEVADNGGVGAAGGWRRRELTMLFPVGGVVGRWPG